MRFEDVAAALLARQWVFAKTMPQDPHHYTLRKHWGNDAEFEAVVQYIRDHGYRRTWGRRAYTYLDINGERFWTMGAALPATILINRAVAEHVHPYDEIAKVYDKLFVDELSQSEDAAVIAALGYAGGSVLDIGCGTGLLLDHMTPDEYLGIDPSRGMLDQMAAKHPGARTMATGLEGFWTTRKFDLVVGLFGAPSYVSPDALARVPDMLTPGGRYHLMFYREGYRPTTHDLCGVCVPYFTHPRDVLPGVVRDSGNFFVIQGGGHEVLPEAKRL